MLSMLAIKLLICTWIRFLLVIPGVYRQIRSQPASVMSDIDEDVPDRAFDLLRPSGMLHPDHGQLIINVVSCLVI